MNAEELMLDLDYRTNPSNMHASMLVCTKKVVKIDYKIEIVGIECGQPINL